LSAASAFIKEFCDQSVQCELKILFKD